MKRLPFTKNAPPFYSSREAWALVKPESVVAGSAAQAQNVLACALADIETLHAMRSQLMESGLRMAGVLARLADRYDLLFSEIDGLAEWNAAIAKAEGK